MNAVRREPLPEWGTGLRSGASGAIYSNAMLNSGSG
jgi:hypothetical protein